MQLLSLRHSSLRLWFQAYVLDRRASLVVAQSKPLRHPRSRVGCVLYNVSSEKDIWASGWELTKLRSQRAILGHTCPLIGPCLVPVRTNTDHGLDGEAHARLCRSNCLVLRVMRNVGRAMEELVDTVPAVRPDYATVLALCVLLDDVSVLTEECAWLNNLDSLVQALSCSLRYPHRVWVGQSLVSDVECFV